MKRDPIINTPSTPSGSPRNTSAGRIKSISGGGPNYSGSNATTKCSPPPNNPYKGR